LLDLVAALRYGPRMQKFKLFFVLLPLIFSSPAFAWEKLVNCNNGALVLDFQMVSAEQAEYQMVLRYSALDYFLKMGSISPSKVNARNEFIVPMTEYLQHSFIGAKSNVSNRERITYRVAVDHLSQAATVVIERRDLADAKLIQVMKLSFTGCYTR
jgi:hypothetical protein